MSSVFVSENHVLCINKDANKYVNSLTSCVNSRHLLFPRVHSQIVPGLPEPKLQLLSREPSESRASRLHTVDPRSEFPIK